MWFSHNFKKNIQFLYTSWLSTWAVWPASSALYIRARRVLAQLRQVALELRHVIAPRVLAHLVERARDRAVVAVAALVALVQLPPAIFQRLQSRSHFLTLNKNPLSLFTPILTFCFKSQIFYSHFSLKENADFCHSQFILTLIEV